MKVRADIVVKGRVRMVGYRELVDERAFPLEIKGFVRHLPDGNVEVVCEGDSAVVQSFIKRITVVKYPVRVTGVEVRYSDATGEFADFCIMRDGGPLSELCERLEAAVSSLRDMQQELAARLEKQQTERGAFIPLLDRQYEQQARMLVVMHKSLERLDRAVRAGERLLDNGERGLRKQDAGTASVRSLDRHSEERIGKLGRRLDRISSSLTGIARDASAIRRSRCNKKGRRKRVAPSAEKAPPAPQAVDNGVALPGRQEDRADGGIAG